MAVNSTIDFAKIIDKPKAANKVWMKEPVEIPRTE